MVEIKMSQKKNSLEGPKPSFFKKIQNYIDYNDATTRFVANPSVASKLKKALEDIVTANEESKKKEKAARVLQKFGKKVPKLNEEERRKRRKSCDEIAKLWKKTTKVRRRAQKKNCEG